MTIGKLSIDEAKKMIGTEFTYVYEDGDTILAYVKAFDPEIGLTCYTLETETAEGWVSDNVEIDPDGTWCVMGYRVGVHELSDMLTELAHIKNFGRSIPLSARAYGVFNGCGFL